MTPSLTPSFDFYRNVFLGSAIQPDLFPPLAAKAAAFVRAAVGPRCLAASPDTQTALCSAVCAVAEILQLEESALHAAFPSVQSVQQESVGDYSVTYQPPASLSSDTAQTLYRKKVDALRSCLAHLPAFADLFSVRSFPCSLHIP